jgi:DNA-binding transcriptional ArsR family regulator
MVVGTLKGEKQTDRLFFALSDTTRRDILTQTLDRERSVSELGRLYPISLTAVQKHVEVLVDAGLVSKHRSGREQLVRGEVNQLGRAHELVDELEAVVAGPPRPSEAPTRSASCAPRICGGWPTCTGPTQR